MKIMNTTPIKGKYHVENIKKIGVKEVIHVHTYIVYANTIPLEIANMDGNATIDMLIENKILDINNRGQEQDTKLRMKDGTLNTENKEVSRPTRIGQKTRPHVCTTKKTDVEEAVNVLINIKHANTLKTVDSEINASSDTLKPIQIEIDIMEEMLNNMKQIKLIMITPKKSLITQTAPIREIKMGPERKQIPQVMI